MKYSVFTYSKKGCETALRILDLLNGEELSAWCPARFLEEQEPEPAEHLSAAGPETESTPNPLNALFSPIPKRFRPFYGECFEWSDAMIFVGACGIAVREIAPFIKSKKTDPAVICIDDRARFVIPVLSGHIGGANELAGRLAAQLDAVPVITTATDINKRFSVDAWAARNAMVIGNMKTAKHVSAAILDADVPICCELPVAGAYPPGTFPYNDPAEKNGTEQEPVPDEVPPIGICISWHTRKPFPETLHLIPKVLTVGIGCRKGTSAEAIRTAVKKVFDDHELDLRAVRGAASIDLKAEEEGLLSFCAGNDWEIRFYSAEELKAAEGEFTRSEFVKSITGVDNVCERSAVMQGGQILIPKTAMDGVTIAVSIDLTEVAFE